MQFRKKAKDGAFCEYMSIIWPWREHVHDVTSIWSILFFFIYGLFQKYCLWNFEVVDKSGKHFELFLVDTFATNFHPHPKASELFFEKFKKTFRCQIFLLLVENQLILLFRKPQGIQHFRRHFRKGKWQLFSSLNVQKCIKLGNLGYLLHNYITYFQGQGHQ